MWCRSSGVARLPGTQGPVNTTAAPYINHELQNIPTAYSIFPFIWLNNLILGYIKYFCSLKICTMCCPFCRLLDSAAWGGVTVQTPPPNTIPLWVRTNFWGTAVSN